MHTLLNEKSKGFHTLFAGFSYYHQISVQFSNTDIEEI